MIYSISEITKRIKDLIEKSIPIIEVEGEISNFKPHYSGHAYFVLKDDNAQINAIMWKSNVDRLLFNLKDGQKVKCVGQITLFDKQGKYQIVISGMEEFGKGDLQQQFEALKLKLFTKGYFAEARKKSIPKFSERIGLVTSPTGAAIADMISVATRRNASVQLILRPIQVQGASASADIVAAIDEFNQLANVDLIIVGRGGGSLEDLWAFNEEIVADAIFNSKIPIISAVGHEIDFSISDFVADLRAATPSAAMEIAVMAKDDLLANLAYYIDKFSNLKKNYIDRKKSQLNLLKSHYALKKPDEIVKQKRVQLTFLLEQFRANYLTLLTDNKNKLNLLRLQLQALNPNSILARGYVILYQNGHIIESKNKLLDGNVRIKFKDGDLEKTMF